MKTGTRMRHQYLLISLYIIRICNRSWKLTIIASCPGVIRCRDVKVWGSHTGDFEDFRLLRCDTAWPDNYQTIPCLNWYGISCKVSCHITSVVWWYSVICAGPVPFRYTAKIKVSRRAWRQNFWNQTERILASQFSLTINAASGTL